MFSAANGGNSAPHHHLGPEAIKTPGIHARVELLEIEQIAKAVNLKHVRFPKRGPGACSGWKRRRGPLNLSSSIVVCRETDTGYNRAEAFGPVTWRSSAVYGSSCLRQTMRAK